MLNLIGIGLCDEKDITIRGLDAVKKCKYVYLENYTSKLQCEVSALEKLYGKKIILAEREMIEIQLEKEILDKAKSEDVALLIIGDVFSATTHIDIMLRAKTAGVEVNIVNNTSILTAVGITGLELYKFGKTTSIPFPETSFKPETPYNVLQDNQKIGLHTLILLDLRPSEDRFMSVNDAIKYMLMIEDSRKEKVFTEDTPIIGCARLGCPDAVFVSGRAGEIVERDFGKSPHCLIVPGKLHFKEEEALAPK